MPEEHDQIEIRSEEVQEILSDIPGWLLKWGITVFFGIVVAILILSWIIRYPDIVPAQIIITTENPPEHMVAKTSGKINLFVKEEQVVKKGEVLAIIENPAKYEDILTLDSIIRRSYDIIYDRNFDPFLLELNTILDLGEVQSAFGNYFDAVKSATRTKKIAANKEQIKSTQSSLIGLQNSRKILLRQLENAKVDIQFSKKIYETDSLELTLGVKDSITFLRDSKSFINSQQSLDNIESQLLQNQIEISRTKNSLREQELNNEDDGETLRNRIKVAYSALEVGVQNWKERFLFISSIDGTISLSKFWSNNQYIQNGEELLVAIPERSDIIGRMELPIAGSGKVEEGQKVNIKFENYPSNDYGILVGHIENIALVPREDKYSVTVKVEQKLISTYKKEIPFRQEMRGAADIITEDKRLFERIFNQLRKLLDTTS